MVASDNRKTFRENVESYVDQAIDELNISDTIKPFNKVCLQTPLGGQSQRPTATPVKATSRFKVTQKRTRDYKDQLYEYIKQHPRQEMLDKPSNAWGCTWPDFKHKYKPVLPKDFSLAEIGNYDARFKVTPKRFKKGYSNFVQ